MLKINNHSKGKCMQVWDNGDKSQQLLARSLKNLQSQESKESRSIIVICTITEQIFTRILPGQEGLSYGKKLSR